MASNHSNGNHNATGHQTVFNKFMKYSGYVTAAVITVLILMAIFLT